MTRFDRPSTVNEACTHKRAQHRHGTYVCYVHDGCRCKACSTAAVAYRAHETRQRAYKVANHGVERFAAFVDARPVLEHVRALQAAGMGTKLIAKRAGVSASTIGCLLWGRGERDQGPRMQVTRQVREAILAVPLPTPEELAGGARVPARPTANRLRALHHHGYTTAALAHLAGVDHQPLRAAMARPDGDTTARTHKAIAKLFNELKDCPNFPDAWRLKAAANRARNLAAKHEWPQPRFITPAGNILRRPHELPDTSIGVDLDRFLTLIREGRPYAEACALAGVATRTQLVLAAKRARREDVLQIIGEAA